MKYVATLLLLGLSVMTAESVNFDKVKAGSLPAGWTGAMTSTGVEPKWEVVRDETAPSKPNVLAQTSTDKTPGRFPMAIYDKASIMDGKVSVKAKPISGTVDQAIGLVWRYRDENNYYVVRGNAIEGNVVLYKVQDGERIMLSPKGTPPNTKGVNRQIPAQAWISFAVEFKGNLFTVLVAGEKMFDVEDNTFSGAGKVGLWTKADSVTYFDDFSIEKKK